MGEPAPKPALLVSIHDVSPITWGESTQAIELARAAGLPDKALSLLVIPRHEGTASLGDAPDFVKWLQGLAADGVTLIAHGFTHRMPRRLIGWGQRSWMEALVTDAHARLQAARRPADTRLAIHPPNMRSRRCRRSIRHCLETLLDRLEPLSYTEFVSRAPAA